jgi:hypothetical protein
MTVEHDSASGAFGVSSEGSGSSQVVGRAGGEVSNMAGAASEGVREVAGEVSTQARAVAGQAREQLEGFVGEARRELEQQAQQRSEQTADRLRTLSEQLVALAEGRVEGAGSLAGLLYDAEGRVRGLASRLEQRGPVGVSEDLRDFARRRPGVFLAAAAGVGFVIGRVARAGSSAQRDDGAVSEPLASSPSRALAGGSSLLVGDGATSVAGLAQ